MVQFEEGMHTEIAYDL